MRTRISSELRVATWAIFSEPAAASPPSTVTNGTSSSRRPQGIGPVPERMFSSWRNGGDEEAGDDPPAYAEADGADVRKTTAAIQEGDLR